MLSTTQADAIGLDLDIILGRGASASSNRYWKPAHPPPSTERRSLGDLPALAGGDCSDAGRSSGREGDIGMEKQVGPLRRNRKARRISAQL
jgi:hypothetical protein